MSVVQRIYGENESRIYVKENRRTRNTISLRKSLADRRRSGITPVIGEFKRSSPSGFRIPEGVSPAAYFKRLAEMQVAGISVLTEPRHFLGSYEDLVEAQSIGLPVLAKDFISNERMITSSYNSGADAVLLIADFLSRENLRNLVDFASGLGMESLVEFHDPQFLVNYEPCDSCLLGYNRRNLITMKIEDNTMQILALLTDIPGPKILESGLKYGSIDPFLEERFDGFLIGTSLLEAKEGSI
ncbi:MAG: indole-3-glycerol-phosphate synthase [Candidatus Thermoplasmatota archaeon]|nr:indole-3-glycerol-phosphate synthase [Candidatus Thermoplasmatota archaeon]